MSPKRSAFCALLALGALFRAAAPAAADNDAPTTISAQGDALSRAKSPSSVPPAVPIDPSALSTGAAANTPPPAPTPPAGSLESSKIRLDAHDVPGALADAQSVISKGGGADAYAARADAHRAQGRPFQEVLADYAEAAKLDPRYIEKYRGLIAQQASEEHPDTQKSGRGLNGVPMGFIAAVGAAGSLLIVGAVLLARRRGGKTALPNDEEIKPGGKKQAPDAAEGGPKAAAPPAKEPDKP